MQSIEGAEAHIFKVAATLPLPRTDLDFRRSNAQEYFDFSTSIRIRSSAAFEVQNFTADQAQLTALGQLHQPENSFGFKSHARLVLIVEGAVQAAQIEIDRSHRRAFYRQLPGPTGNLH